MEHPLPDFELNELTRKALQYAAEAHASVNHMRKYTEEPYIVHPIEVAEIYVTTALVNGLVIDDNLVCAAFLHDVLEDTCTDKHPKTKRQSEILQITNVDVLSLVIDLTDPLTLADGNRDFRVTAERERLASISPRAQTIKYCDLVANTKSIAHYDPQFGPTYLREKRRVLGVMDKGEAFFYGLAWQTLEEAEQKVEQYFLDRRLFEMDSRYRTRWPWPETPR